MFMAVEFRVRLSDWNISKSTVQKNSRDFTHSDAQSSYSQVNNQ
jgi:hypothetical protein